jgi:hypothetical protein
MRHAVLATALALALAACSSREAPVAKPPTDSAFAEVQARGATVMGVDQYTSAHVFEDLPDGGRIVLERDDPVDSAGIATIRAHMRQVAADFTAGDFSKPFAVHAMVVPGTRTMAERRDRITYETTDRLKGAEVRIRSADTKAISAVHEFLAFQRSGHRAAGHEGMDHSSHTGTPAPQPTGAPPK